ncbi:hypothetical protein NIBR502774_12495 [Rhizobium sp. NIBRBAC000502774]|nr:hypothetical protein NIBR502774_12495 [Rhizobium sp. NIBRBAC000502774]
MKSIIQKFLSSVKNQGPVAVPPPSSAARPHQTPTILVRTEAIVAHLLNTIEDITVQIDDRPGGHKLRVHGSIEAKIDLIFQIQTADITHTEVALAFRGQGRCRRFLQQLHQALADVGFERMTLNAVRDGRVAWAALGFRPTHPAWRAHRHQLVSKFEALRLQYPLAIAETIEGLIEADNLAVFPMIANLRYDERPGLQPRELSAIILSALENWNGEFNIGDESYTQYLFAR